MSASTVKIKVVDSQRFEDRFRIRWRLSAGKKAEQGISATAPDEAKAKAAYAAAIATAEKGGWERAPAKTGGRHIVLRPIPPAMKRRGRKPKKAR